MKRIAAIFLGMLVLACVGLLVRGGGDAATGVQERAPGVTTVDVVNEDVEAPAAPRAEPAAAVAEVQSIEIAAAAVLPLRDRFADLDAAARAGNARAACDLAAELDRCAKVEAFQRANPTEDQVTRLAQRGIEPDDLQTKIDALVARDEVLGRVSTHCAGIPREVLRTDADYFAMAASAGHVPSQLRILGGGHLHAAAVLRDPTLLDDYRANAATYFNNVVQAGELDLLRLVARGLRYGSEMPIDEFMPAEWREPAFINALIDLLSEEQRAATFPPGMLPTPGEEPTTEQRQRAEEIYSRHFANSTPPHDYSPRSGMTDVEMLEQALSADRHRCAEAAR